MPVRPDASYLVGLAEVAAFLQLPQETVRKLIGRQALPPFDVLRGYRVVLRSAVEAAGVLIGREAVAVELGFALPEMRTLWRSMKVGGIVEIDRQMVTTRYELAAWRASAAGAAAVDELRMSIAKRTAQGHLPV